MKISKIALLELLYKLSDNDEITEDKNYQYFMRLVMAKDKEGLREQISEWI